MSVVLAGGGTAGLIEPALALADALRRADPRIQITCLGPERGLEIRLVPLRGYDLALIPAVPLPRSLTPQLLSVPGRLGAAIGAAADVLDDAEADVVVGFGGYVATPAYLAARRRGIPIVVHEANSRPGLANRIGARLTSHVFTGQPGTRLPHATFIGIPIRREIAGLDRLAFGDKARAHFGLRLNPPPVEEVGGGIIVDDAQLSPEWIVDTLLPVVLDPELVAAMSRAAAEAGRRDADRWLAAEVIDVVRGAGRRGGRRRPPRREGEGGGARAGGRRGRTRRAHGRGGGGGD